MFQPSSRKRGSTIALGGFAPVRKKKPFSMRFDCYDPILHDVCLIVTDQKFYVSKKDLARHSKFFHNMFFDNCHTRDADIIEMFAGCNPFNFQSFLEIINGIRTLTDSNVEGVLRLGNIWETPVVEAVCIEFLLNRSQMTYKQKFLLADEYQNDQLLDHVLSNVKTYMELVAVLPENTNFLRYSTKDKIAEKKVLLMGLIPRNVSPENYKFQMMCFKIVFQGTDVQDQDSKEENYSRFLEHHEQRISVMKLESSVKEQKGNHKVPAPNLQKFAQLAESTAVEEVSLPAIQCSSQSAHRKC